MVLLKQWQYIWLIVYLRAKPVTSYDGVEMHIAPLLNEHSTRCMPIKRARAIQGQIKDRATLPTILSKVDQMRRRMEGLEADLNGGIRRQMESLEKDLKGELQNLTGMVASLLDGAHPAAGGQQKHGTEASSTSTSL